MTEQTTRAGRSATRMAFWLLPVYAVWLVAFIFLAPEGYIEAWIPWLAVMLLSVLPLLVGLGFAIKGLRLGDRLAWAAVAAHGVLLALFAVSPLIQRFVD